METGIAFLVGRRFSYLCSILVKRFEILVKFSFITKTKARLIYC